MKNKKVFIIDCLTEVLSVKVPLRSCYVVGEFSPNHVAVKEFQSLGICKDFGWVAKQNNQKCNDECVYNIHTRTFLLSVNDVILISIYLPHTALRTLFLTLNNTCSRQFGRQGQGPKIPKLEKCKKTRLDSIQTNQNVRNIPATRLF